MAIISVLLFVFAAMFIAIVIPSRYEFIGDVESIEIEDKSIVINCMNALVKIRFFSEEIVRITVFPEGEILETRSYAVASQPDEEVHFRLSELDRLFLIDSKKLRIEIEKKPCRIAIFDSCGTLIVRDHDEFGFGWQGSRKSCWKELHEEPFYGLGEKTGEFNKRGKTFTMWNSDTPGYTLTQDPIYQTHPFFLSLYNDIGFGIFLDNSYRTNFNFGAGTDRFYSFEAEDGVFDYYVIYGPRLLDVIAHYSSLVGTMPLPPKWSLGYQQSRWSYSSDTDVLAIAKKFRDRNIPCDALYLDIDYMDEYRCFTWHPRNFPDPKTMIRKLQDMGFKVVVIIDPGIKVDENYSIYKKGVNGDHFCKYPDGTLYQGQVWPGWCCFPDFSRNATREWWGSLYKRLVDMGVDGFWNDMNEPATWGGTFPNLVQFAGDGIGSDHLEMHNLYGALMVKASYEGLKSIRKNRREFVLTRSGYSGVQRYAATWTGDNVSSWEHLRLAVKMCLGLSMSGYAFCGSDIGGFKGSPSPELYSRWLQFGIFSPLCRTHTAINTPDQEPWSYGEEFEVINRKIIELRYRLLPYLYNEFHRSSKNGFPIIRPMVLEVSARQKIESMDDQYMFGSDLLVAPVLQENARCRSVYLPPGDWFNFWTEERLTGDREINVDAPLEQIPLFVRAGAMIPMQGVMNYVDEREADLLELHIYSCDGSSVRSIYEDDGLSMGYLNEDFRVTSIESNAGTDKIWVRIEYSHGNRIKAARTWNLILHGIMTKPRAIKVDAMEIELSGVSTDKYPSAYFIESKNCLYILIRNEEGPLEVNIGL